MIKKFWNKVVKNAQSAVATLLIVGATIFITVNNSGIHVFVIDPETGDTLQTTITKDSLYLWFDSSSVEKADSLVMSDKQKFINILIRRYYQLHAEPKFKRFGNKCLSYTGAYSDSIEIVDTLDIEIGNDSVDVVQDSLRSWGVFWNIVPDWDNIVSDTITYNGSFDDRYAYHFAIDYYVKISDNSKIERTDAIYNSIVIDKINGAYTAKIPRGHYLDPGYASIPLPVGLGWSDIDSLSNQPDTVSLINLYNFNLDTILIDSIADSIGSNNGKLLNGVVVSATSKKYGSGSLYLDGSDDYVNIGVIDYMQRAGKFSISFWMNQAADSANDSIITSTYDANNGFSIHTRVTGVIVFKLKYGGVTNQYSYNYLSESTAGQWHHYTFVYDTSLGTAALRGKFYMDGVNKVMAPTGDLLNAQFLDGKDFWIGTPVNSFNGYLDNVKFYNDAISANKIATEYKAEIENYRNDTITTSLAYVDTVAAQQADSLYFWNTAGDTLRRLIRSDKRYPIGELLTNNELDTIRIMAANNIGRGPASLYKSVYYSYSTPDTIIRYVNTASTAGGNGTTNDTVGVNRAFATAAEWEASMQADLVVLNQVHIVYCCGTAADGTSLQVNGWGTDNTHTITIAGNPDHIAGRHKGKWSTDHYRIAVSASGGYCVSPRVDYVTVRGIQMNNFYTGGGAYNIFSTTATTGIEFDGCIVNVANIGRGFAIANAANDYSIYNSYIYGGGVAGDGINVSNTSTMKIYNCTIEGFAGDGIESGGTTICEVYNSAVFNNDDDFDDGTIAIIDHCASDDGDGTNPQTLNSASNYINEFTNFVSGDLTLVEGGVCVDNAATDPSSGLYDYDILNNVRTVPWDIGAFMYCDSVFSDTTKDTTCLSLDSLQIFTSDSLTLCDIKTGRDSVVVDTISPAVDTIVVSGDSIQLIISACSGDTTALDTFYVFSENLLTQSDGWSKYFKNGFNSRFEGNFKK